MNDQRVHNGKQEKFEETSKNSYYTQFIMAAVIFMVFTEKFASYWRTGGELVEYYWHYLVDNYGQNNRMFCVVGTTTYTFLLYWSLGLIYTIMDVTNKPKFLRKYKIQQGTNEPLDTSKILKITGYVLFNQTVVTIPISYLGSLVHEISHPPYREVPSFFRVASDFCVFVLSYEIVYYYVHRLIHTPRLYKYIHKRHHEWTAPIAISAIYCHPLEHIFANTMPQLVGLGIMKSHLLTSWLWFTYVIVLTLNDHSGYHLPFAQSPELHDFHHFRFNTNYGVFGFWDKLHGTDGKFRATKGYERNHVILGLSSARDLHPDD